LEPDFFDVPAKVSSTFNCRQGHVISACLNYPECLVSLKVRGSDGWNYNPLLEKLEMDEDMEVGEEL
jgi:hypothetical protein